VEIDTTVTKDGVVSIAGSSHLIGFAWARRRVHPATRRAPRPVGKTRYVSASVRNLSANRREVPSQRARAPKTWASVSAIHLRDWCLRRFGCL